MRRFIVLLALWLAAPSPCGATELFVKRAGCFHRVQRPKAAVAPTYSAGQAIATLAGKKAEWAFITESIAQLFGGSLATSDYSASLQRGNTVYGHVQPAWNGQGYSLQSFATVTPQPLDVEALLERATRLATQSQQHGAQATAQAQGLIGQAQAGQQAIAQTFAQAARELAVLEALQPIAPQEVKSKVSTTATVTANAGAGAAPAINVATAQVLPDWRPRFAAVVATRCATCHDAESPAGGLNLAGDVAALDRERLLAMLARVSTTDATKRMPKDGEPLSDADVMLFVKAFAAK